MPDQTITVVTTGSQGVAPLLVDTVETKRNLIEKCGLEAIYRLAESLNLAIVSSGDIGPHSTSLSEASSRVTS